MSEFGKAAKATPGCTTQACSIRYAMPDLKSLGIAAVGISPDEPKTQKKFADKYQLSFHATAVAYGAWGENQGILRSSFLVDEAGKVLQAWYKVSPADTVSLANEALGSK